MKNNTHPKRLGNCWFPIDYFKVGKKYYKRTGHCQPKKCASACCKIFAGTDREHLIYQASMLGHKLLKKGKLFYFKHVCKKLKEGKCSIWKTRSACCSQFPRPTDGVYNLVKRNCTIKFKRITKKEYESWCKKYLKKKEEKS